MCDFYEIGTVFRASGEDFFDMTQYLRFEHIVIAIGSDNA